MTRPHRFLLPMILLLACVAVASVLLWKGLSFAFFANVFLNSIIFAVLLFGIGYSFFQVLRLNPEVAWIEGFRRNQPGLSLARPPRLLAPMATMLGERKGRISLSAVSMRSLLDTIGDAARRIARPRPLPDRPDDLPRPARHLLGPARDGRRRQRRHRRPVDRDRRLHPVQRPADRPARRRSRAWAPRSAPRLLGLAGSLVLGFLDLQAGRAQNRFYNELEDWLSGLTRLSSGGPVSDGDQPVPAYIQALLEQTADNLENLQRTMARAEDSRSSGNAGDRVARRPADAAHRADARASRA